MGERAQSDQLRTTLTGEVHRADCPDLAAGMTWLWEGRNALNGDRPCPSCLPDGLPDRERWKPTPEEAARIRQIVDMPADDLRWASCSQAEFGPVGMERHLVQPGALTTLCGHGASTAGIWRADSRKPKCKTCAVVEAGR